MAKYSNYIGVTFDKRRNKWMAGIKNNGKNKFLGYFDNENDAYQARLKAEDNMKNILSKNIKELYNIELVEKYKSGMTISELAKFYKKDYSTIYESLIKLNIKLRNDLILLSDNDKSIILKKYLLGETIINLANDFKVNYEVIYRYLQNVTELRPNRKYFLKDENFLKNIDVEWKAYFLGLLYADGNMRSLNNKHNKSKTISISLTEADSYILQELNCILFDSPSKLYYKPSHTYFNKKTQKEYTGKPSYKLMIHNSIVYDDLLAMGCHPNKSTTIEYPKNIPDNMFNHFLRGYFDGDGWFTAKSTFGIIGSYNFCKTIKEKIKNILNFDMILIPCGCVCRLVKHTQKDYEDFKNFIYSDATIFLSRKKDRRSKNIYPIQSTSPFL